MKLHEYQAKQLFAEAGIPTPDARLAETVDEATTAAAEIGYPVAVKAQVHVGGRGKAGGIEIASDRAEVERASEDILGMDLKGYTVEQVLVEEAIDFVDELYIGITLDRHQECPVAIVSTEGGVDIEQVSEDTPDAIVREHIDPAFGMYPYQARQAAYNAGIDQDVAGDVASIIATMYELYESRDASEVEINPVMITADRELVAADAVVKIDEDALFRQPVVAEMGETAYDDEIERMAGEYEFDYVRLSGDVGIIGNGAGLVMTTLDLVDHFDGSPANFLDIGGGAKAKRVSNALEVVFADENVESVVFNIFGGITRGDEVAKGINTALSAFDELPTPVVVRLAGTNSAEGMEILDDDLVDVRSTLEAAVQQAVENAQGVPQ